MESTERRHGGIKSGYFRIQASPATPVTALWRRLYLPRRIFAVWRAQIYRIMKTRPRTYRWGYVGHVTQTPASPSRPAAWHAAVTAQPVEPEPEHGERYDRRQYQGQGEVAVPAGAAPGEASSRHSPSVRHCLSEGCLPSTPASRVNVANSDVILGSSARGMPSMLSRRLRSSGSKFLPHQRKPMIPPTPARLHH
jgi:hypothetical protein